MIEVIEECPKGGEHDWSVWKKYGSDGYTQNTCRKCYHSVTDRPYWPEDESDEESDV